MKKFICIHGHFYQPPRENAWLEIVERQVSAHPYHDWNERISAECYHPNACSRILNGEQKIIDIVNNYASVSFNFGPTLLSWMEKYDPETYAAILEGDRISTKKYNGHGNAIAQVYNHLIMPLANTRDKITQIVWGIADFKKRFQRDPEGMWLAETAVDTETLELLAQHKIKFTILAPRQAKAVRKLNESNWKFIQDEDKLDSTVPYTCRLPSGNSITLFFYHGKISRDVAFNGLLNSGELFSEQLLGEFKPDTDTVQLINIATDGETYGHHHYRGDMALASCIDFLEDKHDVQITNYAHFLSLFQPQHEVQINENSSWSCVHGVERWRNDCGCTDGAHPAYHQKWREPLRSALNWLRDHLAVIYENELKQFTPDIWGIRNKYIEVILNRNDASTDEFMKRYFPAGITAEQKAKIARMLEMQRQALLMFTSCGWFFEEIAGIEAKQILHYADRAIQIAEHETNIKLYDDFLNLLSLAPSNLPAYGNGAVLYEKEIRPQRITLTKVGIHHAVLSVFDEIPIGDLANYTIRKDFFEQYEAGDDKLVVGNLFLTSTFTFASQDFQFVAVYLGRHHVLGGYAEQMNTDLFEEVYLRAREEFRNGNITGVNELIDEYFGANKFYFRDLFMEERQKLLNVILKEDIVSTIQNYRNTYEKNYSLLLEMRKEQFPIPELLRKNLEMAVNAELMDLFGAEKFNVSKLDHLAGEVQTWDIELDNEEIGFYAAAQLYQLVSALKNEPINTTLIDSISKIMIRLSDMKIKLHLSKVQNIYFMIGKQSIGNEKFMQATGAETYQKWLIKFKAVGEQLNIRF